PAHHEQERADRQGPLGNAPPAQHGAEREHRALSEVDQVGHTEDQEQANRDQRVGVPGDQAAGERVEHASTKAAERHGPGGWNGGDQLRSVNFPSLTTMGARVPTPTRRISLNLKAPKVTLGIPSPVASACWMPSRVKPPR